MEEFMVHLRKITEENFIDAFHLKLAPGQERFVSHPIRSLAQAYVYREQCQPFGIYEGDRMVGYVMVIYHYRYSSMCAAYFCSHRRSLICDLYGLFIVYKRSVIGKEKSAALKV